MRTELPSGAQVEHRPISDLRRKDKRAVASVLRARLPFGADGEISAGAAVMIGGDLLYEAAAVVAGCILTGWSYDLPLPRWDADREAAENAASLDELTLEDSDALDALLAPYISKLLARPDPKEATTSSSNGSSRAKAATSRRG